MADDHAYQAISCYDKKLINTPNIDKLANDGVKFVNSFVANSISAPSRACMLTGKHSHMNGHLDNRTKFDGSQQTFPKLLRNAGYQTAMIGKWHLKSTPTGFDYWEVLPGQGDYYNPDFIQMNGKKKRFEGYVTDITMDKSINWIDQRDKTKPFCMLIHQKAPHRNWMPNTKDLELFKGQKFELPETFFDQYENRQAAKEQKLSIRDDMTFVWDLKMLSKDSKPKTGLDKHYRKGAYGRMSAEQKKLWDKHYEPIIKEFNESKLTGKELHKWKFQRYMEDYLKCVKSVDDNVGKLIKYLKKNDLYENTLIVYTSDQGFFLGEHGWFDKRFMYEETFKTPLVMKLPNSMKRRGVVNELVQNIDYAPSFLELAGVKIPKDIQGESLLSLLKSEKVDWREDLYYHYYEFPNVHAVKKHYGIRTARYKLIHFYDDIDTWELYDLEKDKHEMNNIYNNPENKGLIKDLKLRLKKLEEKYQVNNEVNK
jgi:arylsulfatase A-like enzyme